MMMPYRLLDNVIDGVVITLLDITATKALEQALHKHLCSQWRDPLPFWPFIPIQWPHQRRYESSYRNTTGYPS